MGYRHEMIKRIKRKEQEIVDWKNKFAEIKSELEKAESYLLALNDSLRLYPNDENQPEETRLRANSDLAKARDALKKAGHPLHVNALLEQIGKTVTKSNRVSLSGSIGNYVREGKIFTRPLPNTFGLKEFDTPSAEDIAAGGVPAINEDDDFSELQTDDLAS